MLRLLLRGSAGAPERRLVLWRALQSLREGKLRHSGNLELRKPPFASSVGRPGRPGWVGSTAEPGGSRRAHGMRPQWRHRQQQAAEQWEQVAMEQALRAKDRQDIVQQAPSGARSSSRLLSGGTLVSQYWFVPVASFRRRTRGSRNTVFRGRWCDFLHDPRGRERSACIYLRVEAGSRPCLFVQART